MGNISCYVILAYGRNIATLVLIDILLDNVLSPVRH